MTALYSLYPNGDTAQRAVNRLRAVGVPDHQIVVMSSEPLEDYDFAHKDQHTWMWWIAAGAGLLGCLCGVWLTTMTQTSWPIVTGNMPLTPVWTNTVIVFELTMLFAMIATVITFLVSAGLPGRGPRLYDPAVSEGQILVGVEGASVEAHGHIERALTVDSTVAVTRV